MSETGRSEWVTAYRKAWNDVRRNHSSFHTLLLFTVVTPILIRDRLDPTYEVDSQSAFSRGTDE